MVAFTSQSIKGMAKALKSLVIAEEIIVGKIHHIRKQKVMLDRDLAALFGVKPVRLREQVKRNIERFLRHFMFRLNSKEVNTMVSQNAIPSRKHLGGALPYAFTEHGVLMVANVLKSKRAISVSLRVIEIFVKLRQMLLTHKDILLKLEQLERKVSAHDGNIQMIFEALKRLLCSKHETRPRIGFKRSYERDSARDTISKKNNH